MGIFLLVLWLSLQHSDYNQEREIACVSVLKRKNKQGLYSNVLKFTYYGEFIRNSSSPEGLTEGGKCDYLFIDIVFLEMSSCVNIRRISYRMVESKWTQ